MGWTDLFKPKLKPDPRIRWFGKLPTYPDYYSSPADEAWAVEFNDWVLKGFEVYQNRVRGHQDKTMRRLPVAACVIRLPQSGMTVFSSILDYGGDMRGRPFPLCFYAGLPTAQWPGPTHDRLIGAARVVRDLLDLRRQVARFLNSPGRFETTFGDRTVDFEDVDGAMSDSSWMDAGKGIAFADWFNHAKDALKIQNHAVWLHMAKNWGDSIAELEGRDFGPTLRFPLAMKLPLGLQVAGWIRWMESRLDVARRNLSLIVSGELDHESGHLTVIARDLVREDFLLFTSIASSLPYLDDLLALQAPDDKSDAQSPATATPAPNPTETWIDFVQT